MRDLVVIVDDAPGELRSVVHALGNAGVNVEGFSALTGQGRSVIHVLVTETERALMALAAASIKPRAVHDVVVINLPDRPDALSSVLESLARSGINILLAYMAVGTRSHSRVAVVTDDPLAARMALGMDAL